LEAAKREREMLNQQDQEMRMEALGLVPRKDRRNKKELDAAQKNQLLERGVLAKSDNPAVDLVHGLGAGPAAKHAGFETKAFSDKLARDERILIEGTDQEQDGTHLAGSGPSNHTYSAIKQEVKSEKKLKKEKKQAKKEAKKTAKKEKRRSRSRSQKSNRRESHSDSDGDSTKSARKRKRSRSSSS
jgi:hypothetical protein